MVFLLLFLGTLLYSSLGYMLGWDSFDFKLMGIQLIYADIDQKGFSLGWYDLQRLGSEYDPVTGEKLSGGDRALAAVMLGLSILNEAIQQKLGDIVLPEAYIEFLKKVNGLDFNGLVIYGVDHVFLDKELDEDIHAFIETNDLWYENEWQKQYIFFGDSDTAWYAYDQKENMYVELDKPSGTLMQSFESFDLMLSDALQTVLL
jgi:hypothetical protein